MHCPNSVTMFTTPLQHCQHCPELSRHLRDDVRPMFKPNSHQHRYGSEMLTRQGFPHIHIYYCNILCYKQEMPKEKAYATLYKCLSIRQQLFRNHFVSKYSKLQWMGCRKETKRCQFSSPAASDLTDEIGCQQVRAHYVAASVHVQDLISPTQTQNCNNSDRRLLPYSFRTIPRVLFKNYV